MASSAHGKTIGSNVSIEIEDDTNDDMNELEEMAPPGETRTKKKMTRKRKYISEVWNHFDLLPEQVDQKRRCKCKHCETIYVADSKYGTGNMKRHISNCVRKDVRDIGQLLINSNSMSFSRFDPQTFRDLLNGAIIMHSLPFQFVEFSGIRAVLSYLKPDLHIVSRNTCRDDCVKIFKREKVRMKNMLEACTGRVCLTSNCWTALNSDGCICLTAHFIDKDWILHKRILNFSFMPPPHNGISLSKRIHNFLCDWGIDLRVFTLTLDNASANDVCVGLLQTQLHNKNEIICRGKYFHMRCWAHIMNLVVQDGLKCIDPSVSKIRECVKYVKGSQGRKQKFLECVSHSSLESKRGLRQDVQTRWNSTYIMLENAIYYRRAFMHLELSDSNFKHCPSREEWDKVEKIKKYLSMFYAITNVFSGSKYPTSNLYFPLVVTAYLRMKEEERSDDGFMSSSAKMMIEKFEKYWDDFNQLLAIAVIMDPRFKLHFVEWSYKLVYGVKLGEIKVSQLKSDLKSLFINYEDSSYFNASITTKEGSLAQGAPEFVEDSTTDLMKMYDNAGCEDSSLKKTQLELCLEEPRVDRKAELDVLSYWKGNQYRYPSVAAMTRDILTIPITTVASESAFSLGGKILDQYRSSLKPEVVEALTCTRDWIYGLKDFKEHEAEELAKTMKFNLNDKEELTTCPLSSASMHLDS